MSKESAQEITRIREAILKELLPNVAIALYADTIAREIRRRHGLPDASAETVTRQLERMKALGQTETVSAGQHAADTGWKLTATGVQAAELLEFA